MLDNVSENGNVTCVIRFFFENGETVHVGVDAGDGWEVVLFVVLVNLQELFVLLPNKEKD